MSKGVTVDQEIVQLAKDIALEPLFKYVILKIENNKLVVDVRGDERSTNEREDDEASFMEMVGHLQSGKPRYVLYKYGFHYRISTEYTRKYFFIFW